MQIPGQAVSIPHVMSLVVVTLTCLMASSLAVSDDKKWLMDTLLSLRHELRQKPAPTYTPPQWGPPGAAPIPTPDNYAYQPPSFGLQQAQSHLQNSKRNSPFLRLSSFGLLCCNHPPTRPPRMKRPNIAPPNAGDWRRLAQLLDSFEQSINSQSLQRVQQPGNVDDSYPSYFDEGEESDQPEVQRRGVTEEEEENGFRHELDVTPGDFL